jgi:hypothetical protein
VKAVNLIYIVHLEDPLFKDHLMAI